MRPFFQWIKEPRHSTLGSTERVASTVREGPDEDRNLEQIFAKDQLCNSWQYDCFFLVIPVPKMRILICLKLDRPRRRKNIAYLEIHVVAPRIWRSSHRSNRSTPVPGSCLVLLRPSFSVADLQRCSWNPFDVIPGNFNGFPLANLGCLNRRQYRMHPQSAHFGQLG